MTTSKSLRTLNTLNTACGIFTQALTKDMKKTLFSLLASLPAFAGTVPSNDSHAPTHCCSIEVSGIYNIATSRLMENESKRFNMWGPEFTGVYRFNDKHAVTLRTSLTYGRHGSANVLNTPFGEFHIPGGKFDWSLMPGYRYTLPITSKIDSYFGINVGFLFSELKETHSYKINFGGSGSRFGFAASSEIGAKYKISQRWSLFAAYQFSGDTARPVCFGRKQKYQMYNGFRAGVGFVF